MTLLIVAPRSYSAALIDSGYVAGLALV